MDSKEIVVRTFEFKNPSRIPLSLPSIGFSDFYGLPLLPDKEWKPSVEGEDEWGSIWERGGKFTGYGRLVKPFLENWNNLSKLRAPKLCEDRFELAKKIIDSGIVEDKFKWGFGGLRLFERMHFLRGLDNLLMDLAEGIKESDVLGDTITEYNIKLIEYAGKIGADGIIDCDDWGTEDRLLISPELWKKFFKPRYARMIKAAKKYRLKTMLHSCGYIIDIIDDLIEIGLEGLDMDQQDNMGLENLSKRFAGRITFECPIDIQKMAQLNKSEIEFRVKKMISLLGGSDGGFIAKEYGSPDAIGVKPEQDRFMAMKFIEYGKYHRKKGRKKRNIKIS